MAVQLWSQDNGEALPGATIWSGNLLNLSPKVLICLDASNTSGNCYGYNSGLINPSLAAFADATTVCLSADYQIGSAVTGYENLLCSSNMIALRHNNGAICSYLDGHVATSLTSASLPNIFCGIAALQLSTTNLVQNGQFTQTGGTLSNTADVDWVGPSKVGQASTNGGLNAAAAPWTFNSGVNYWSCGYSQTHDGAAADSWNITVPTPAELDVPYLNESATVQQSITAPAASGNQKYVIAKFTYQVQTNMLGMSGQVLFDGASIGTFTPSSKVLWDSDTTSDVSMLAGSTHVLTFVGSPNDGNQSSIFIANVVMVDDHAAYAH